MGLHAAATGLAAAASPHIVPGGGLLIPKGQQIDCTAGFAQFCSAPKSTNPILPSVPEMAWGISAFLVLLYILNRFALPPIQRILRERSERIAADIDRAESAKREAEDTLEEYKRELAQARAEAGRMLEEARQAAESVRADLLQRAETEAAEARARNAESLRLEQDRVLAELQSQVREVALDLAEKVVGANLDHDRNMALIDRYLDELNATT